jgi:hypothetical protein
MTLPDTGPERPRGLASDTRQMAEDDTRRALGEGPRGHVVLLVGSAIVIAVLLWLLLR